MVRPLPHQPLHGVESGTSSTVGVPASGAVVPPETGYRNRHHLYVSPSASFILLALVLTRSSMRRRGRWSRLVDRTSPSLSCSSSLIPGTGHPKTHRSVRVSVGLSIHGYATPSISLSTLTRY
jgi:hypothetical protein